MAEGIQIKNLPSTTTIKQGDTMTIVQDKQNKQFSLDVFANESDLATLSPLENRCDEVKAKIEVDEYSAEITTSQSMSEIGSDDNGVNLHENVLDGAYESCVLKGKTKYIDNDTQEILDTFQDGRNLSLIDVKSPILSNCGKNLWSYGDLGEFGVITFKNLNIPRGEYFFTGVQSKMYDYEVVVRMANDITNEEIHGYLNSECSFATKFTTTTINIYSNGYNYVSSINNKLTISNFMMTKNSKPTSYEPYKSNIVSCESYYDEATQSDKTIVLRSLPNGVCDTLNVETGEYVQRIGEIVLDGTHSITSNNVKENTVEFSYGRISTMKIKSPLLCDKLPNSEPYNTDVEGICCHVLNGNFHFNILKSKLPEVTVSGVNTYLSQNPITVQYELETPIVSTVDVQGFPHAYKNGHIQLSSGSIELSLTPTVTYKVPVSRMGQIASNTKSNLRQSIKLDQLEVLVYQSLINAEYENLLVQNSAESAASFTNLSTNDPKDGLYYMLKHLIEENQPVQNMLDKINLFYLYGLLSDEHYFDLLLGGEEDVY